MTATETSTDTTPLAPGHASLIPDALCNIPAVELVALLKLRGGGHARACAVYLAETEATPAQTAEHEFMLVTLGLAKGRDRRILTLKGRMAAELLIRCIATAIGLHIVAVGQEGGIGFVRCSCRWTATQIGPWALIKPMLEAAGADHVAGAEGVADESRRPLPVPAPQNESAKG